MWKRFFERKSDFLHARNLLEGHIDGLTSDNLTIRRTGSLTSDNIVGAESKSVANKISSMIFILEGELRTERSNHETHIRGLVESRPVIGMKTRVKKRNHEIGCGLSIGQLHF